jgi:hypothetical protein
MDTTEYDRRPKRREAKNRLLTARERGGRLRQQQFGDFKCLNCGRPVSAMPALSGVNNRNHCPYCLWSKHVDLRQAGDRLAVCKGPMPPIGLTAKRSGKKYPAATGGELMLVHRCKRCGALSLNRMAADDFVAGAWEVFEAAPGLEPALAAQADAAGIELLSAPAHSLVRAQLFGRGE